MTWFEAWTGHAPNPAVLAASDAAVQNHADLEAQRRALRNDPESIHPTPPEGF